LRTNNKENIDNRLEWKYGRDKDEQFGAQGNVAMQTFDAKGRYTSLARESVQNTIDAAIIKGNPAENLSWQEESVPVEMSFEIINISTSELPDIENHKKMFKKCSLPDIPENETINEKVQNTLSCLEADEIKILKINEEKGTKGMGGVKNDNSITEHSDLHSFFFAHGKNSKTAGNLGSHGTGKNAYLGPSAAATVIVNTKYKNALGVDQTSTIGHTSYMTAPKDGEELTYLNNFWYLSNKKDDKFYPVSNKDINSRYSWLKRTQENYGTTFFILGIQDDHWEEAAIVATMSSFFLFILEKKLKVRIGSTVIDHGTIESVLKEYEEKLKNYTEKEIQDKFGKEQILDEFKRIKYFMKCYNSPTYETTLSVATIGNCKIRLYLLEDDEDLDPKQAKHVVMIRKGFVMCRCHKSRTITLSSNVFKTKTKRFVAIIEPNSSRSGYGGQEYIRKFEDASHSDIDPLIVNDPSEQEKAAKAFEDLRVQVRNWITEKVKVHDDRSDLDMMHIAHLIPIEIEEEGDDSSKLYNQDPEIQKLGKKTKKAKKKTPITINPLPDVPGDEYPEPDDPNPGPPFPGPKPRPPWAGGVKINVSSFKFLKRPKNRVNINFQVEKIGPMSLTLDSPGMDSLLPIKILKCLNKSNSKEYSIKKFVDKKDVEHSFILFEAKDKVLDFELEIQYFDIENISIVPTLFEQAEN